jgi:hypothetical protein
MTDKKDGPGQKDGSAKAGERTPGEGGAKRPHATIDLKAVEVPAAASPSGVVPPQAAQPTGPKPPPAAAPPKDAPGGQAEAARKVAAAAADRRPATGPAASATATSSAAAGAARPGPAAAGRGAAPAGGAAAASAPSSTPPPAARASGGFGGHLLAGVIGAALAVLATPLAGPSVRNAFEGLGIAPPAPVPPEVASRIAALEKKVAAPVAPPSPENDPARANAAVAENRKQLEALQQQLTSMAELQARTAKTATALQEQLAKEPPIADVGTRVQAMEQRLADLAAVANSEPDRAGRIPVLAQLTGRLADLEAALATRVDDIRGAVAKDVETRFAPVVEASEAARSATQRLDREAAGLRTEINRLAAELDQARNSTERLQLGLKAAGDDTAKLATALDGVRRDLDTRLQAMAKPADVAAAVAPLAAQLTGLERNLTTVVKSEGERNATAERIVLSLELGNLKRAMERGLPYSRELAAVAKVAGTRIDLRPLEPYQAQGVPTLAELTRAFRPVAHAILDADAEKGDGTVMDRLLSGARSFVRVRRTTHASDDASPEAVVARIEDALDAGRLAEVLTQIRALEKQPDIARQWIAKVEARQAVDTALAAIDTALKASLGAAPASAPPAAPAKQ